MRSSNSTTRSLRLNAFPTTSTSDDVAVSEWVHALIGAAAADDTKITCFHRRWTKDGGGAFDVQLAADDNGDSAVMWQVEEWVHDANGQTKQKVDPSGVITHRTSVAHANPTPVKLKKRSCARTVLA